MNNMINFNRQTILKIIFIFVILVILITVYVNLKPKKKEIDEIQGVILGKYEGPKLQYLISGNKISTSFDYKYIIIVYDEELGNETYLYISDKEWFDSHVVGDNVDLYREKYKNNYTYIINLKM
mgnify:FL=1